jgi:hypothetical protein
MGKYTPLYMQERKEKTHLQELTEPSLPGMMPAWQMKFIKKS